MKKLPIIRHIRYYYLTFLLILHCTKCEMLGLGGLVQQDDLDYLDQVWCGKK